MKIKDLIGGIQKGQIDNGIISWANAHVDIDRLANMVDWKAVSTLHHEKVMDTLEKGKIDARDEEKVNEFFSENLKEAFKEVAEVANASTD